MVQTVCPRDCYDTCLVEVSVRNGKLMRTMGDKTHPITQGVLCPRGYKDIERVTSTDRILYPHKKNDNEHQRISWGEALSLICNTITHTINTFGPESCLQLSCIGNQGLFSSYIPQRFFYALGFTQTDDSICSKSGHDGLSLHYGLTYGIDPDKLPDMDVIVYWGFNAAVSAPHLYRLSEKSQKKGGTIIAIDPRKSETANSADTWIQVAPGSDVVLAYGVLKYVIENELYNEKFIKEYTLGFEHLKEKVNDLDIDTIETLTGVSWDTICKLAEAYTHKAVTMIGIGMQKSINGSEAVRAISLIPAVVGMHRGFFYSNCQGWYIDIPVITGEAVTTKSYRTVSQVAVGRLLEKGKFKCVYIHNMNPVETLPNHKAVKSGLLRNDVFVVVHDTHWTETATCADVVLPAATYFEKEDIVVSYSHKYIRKSNAIIPPVKESKSEIWVMNRLAHNLNCPEWVTENCWDIIRIAFENSFEKGSFSDLKEGKLITLKMRPENEYQTPSKKIEIYSTRAEKGVAPLPYQHSADKNGYIMLNSALKKYTHTQFQDVFGVIPPLIFINVKDALKIGINDSDIVEVYNELGSIHLKVVISVSVPPGVVWVPRQGKDTQGLPQNCIIPDTTQDIGGGPVFNSTLVKIKNLNQNELQF
jgi:anaerobic selenocysteine-containing dehydrogenase